MANPGEERLGQDIRIEKHHILGPERGWLHVKQGVLATHMPAKLAPKPHLAAILINQDICDHRASDTGSLRELKRLPGWVQTWERSGVQGSMTKAIRLEMQG